MLPKDGIKNFCGGEIMSKKRIIQIALLCVGLPFLFFLCYNLGIFVFTGATIAKMADRMFASTLVSFVTFFIFMGVTCEMKE